MAPSSTALIVGRAVAGMGVGGIFSGALVIIAHARENFLVISGEHLLILQKYLCRRDLWSSGLSAECGDWLR